MTVPLDSVPGDLSENPLPEERTYVRHFKTGDRAYLIRRNGQVLVKFDRPNDPTERAFQAFEWVPDTETRPFTRSEVAQIAHAADQRLCKALGLQREARVEWAHLLDEVKRDRVSGVGPEGNEARGGLYRAIFKFFKPMVRD